MMEPAAAPFVDGLIIQPTTGTHRGMGEVRVCGEHESEPGPLHFAHRCGSLGRYFAGLGELLGSELRLVVGLGQGHPDLQASLLPWNHDYGPAVTTTLRTSERNH